MAYVCEICGSEFTTPASLGSHQRVHKGKAKARANDSEVVVRVLVEQVPIDSRQSDVQSNLYKCPDCGGSLELMKDGPGLYKLRCAVCYQ
jgi:DNA-directed RNA polymerase subunit RPC12/RpoP